MLLGWNEIRHRAIKFANDCKQAVSEFAVERAAQAVLEARAEFPGSTLTDLYDPVAMPLALARAHAELDRAVDRCYRPQGLFHRKPAHA
jgi:hypothetical protein